MEWNTLLWRYAIVVATYIQHRLWLEAFLVIIYNHKTTPKTFRCINNHFFTQNYTLAFLFLFLEIFQPAVWLVILLLNTKVRVVAVAAYHHHQH